MDKIMELLGGFDPAALLPDISLTVNVIELVALFFVAALPLLLVILGLCYFFRPPKEANHNFGYRTYYGMGSVEAWRYAQWLAGLIYMILGGVMLIGAIVLITLAWKWSTTALMETCAICVLVELLLVGAAVITINTILAFRYDRDGYRRTKE